MFKYKLNYRGRNWKKIQQNSTRKWNSKNGPVVAIQEADPNKIQESRDLQQKAKDLYGLQSKKYGGKK